MTMTRLRPQGIVEIDREMDRQNAEALATFAEVKGVAAELAAALRRNRRLLMLGMGGSHAVARAVEPLYRGLGLDALALPLSEQLGAPLPIDDQTVLITSQSGESAEVIRWLNENERDGSRTFGITLEGASALARRVPTMVGVGGPERAFAATRSLTVSFAMHLAVLVDLGLDPVPALNALENPIAPSVDRAVEALIDVDAIVTSGRRLQGLAEALALGLCELSRLPCFSLEGGQLRHGPMEMLGSKVGVVLFRGDDPTAHLVTAMANSVVTSGSPLILFDGSGLPPVQGATTVPFDRVSGMAAIFTMLPALQRFMISFAQQRVDDAGTPVRSSKVTRNE